jgi:hypothetical protein
MGRLPTVIFGVREGSAKVFPGGPVGSINDVRLNAGDEYEVELIQSGKGIVLPTDMIDFFKFVMSLTKHFGYAGIGADDDVENRVQRDGIVYIKNTSGIDIDVTVYQEYNPFLDDMAEEKRIVTVKDGETFEVPVVHVNAMTLQVPIMKLNK